MRYVQQDSMPFLRQVMAVVIAFVASLALLTIFSHNAGATPVSGQPHDSVKTTMGFGLSWQPSQAGVEYQVRISQDKAGLESNLDDTTWFSSWLETSELPFASVAGAKDGDWFWQVRSRDVNHVSDWSEVWRVTVDTTVPEVSFIKPEQAVHGANHEVSLQVSVNDNCANSRCFVKLDEVDITHQLQTTPFEGSTVFTGTIASSGLSDGEHVLLMTASDAYGNKTEQARTFIVDNTAPIIETLLEDGRHIRGVAVLGFSFRDNYPGVYRLDVMRNDSRLSSEEAGLSEPLEKDQGVLSYTWDTTKLAKGSYRLVFTSLDKAGNEAILTRTVEVVSSFLALAGTESVDPLLEQLSERLSQPFIEPTVAKAVSAIPGIAALAANGTLYTHSDESTMLTSSQTARIVIPSKEGWRIFGILWYWWFCAMMAGVLAYRRLKRPYKPSLLNVVPQP